MLKPILFRYSIIGCILVTHLKFGVHEDGFYCTCRTMIVFTYVKCLHQLQVRTYIINGSRRSKEWKSLTFRSPCCDRITCLRFISPMASHISKTRSIFCPKLWSSAGTVRDRNATNGVPMSWHNSYLSAVHPRVIECDIHVVPHAKGIKRSDWSLACLSEHRQEAV